MKLKKLFVILTILFICSSCGTQPNQDGPIYTEHDAVTGVVLKDCTLEDCFTFIMADVGVDSVRQTYILEDVAFKKELYAGDIVLILQKAGRNTRVVIPYGDVPWLYGYLPNYIISTNPQEILNGNEAIARFCDAYDAPNGKQIATLDGKVKILSKDTDWCHVQELGVDSEPIWVKRDDLDFNFDGTILDITNE